MQVRLARRLLLDPTVKSKLDELTKEAQEGAARARELRTRLEEATATVDGLVVEARSTLKRAVEFLEREGLRANNSGTHERVSSDRQLRRADAEGGKSRDRERKRDGTTPRK